MSLTSILEVTITKPAVTLFSTVVLFASGKAAPMVGGMVTAPLLSLFVIPAAYRLMRRRNLSGT
ncbi:hypothetical protein BK659_08360 [Pseudomonas brassicacearum]|uniref:Uncharacterized protein n=1 Tax=Pseudomonas brassicacearum TaxID=930166 RepID=A0A423H9M3_9PSED|nr:hypothetical protein [Pseudomonas brassicacearum]RON09918.1 hypothetical protein BK659_08360 [Pseudomonas brassicacearum]